MDRRPMNPIPNCTFHQAFIHIRNQPRSRTPELKTTGGVSFRAEAKITRDGREFIALPHNNRIYAHDWGYQNNSMGKDGQRIGQYARPLDEWCWNEEESGE